jgi:hypothetical protein
VARPLPFGEVVFHLPEKHHDRWRKAPHLALYARIAEVLAHHGRSPLIAPRSEGQTRPHKAPADGRLHIVEGGAAHGPGWFNAALAYLTGYWHLDPEGVLADSSARHAAFVAPPADEARAFADALRARFVAPKLSRYHQPRAVEALPAGAIAVFLQGPAPHRRKQAHLTDLEILTLVARAAQGRPVLVKAHPLKPEPGRRAIAAARAHGCTLTETGANVHDVLEACAVTVSINSAAALEGMLHGKPAVLCGRADFAPLAETVMRPDDMEAALGAALTRPRDHDAGLTWYFRSHTLEIESGGFETRLTEHLAARGGVG